MADLQVSKKTIGKLFSEMQNKKFIIPDFQRPYKWNTEKCETLWLDIENFAQNEIKTGSDYFLGTIVSYKDKEDNNKEVIIDGQQRITSFMLMLRAFYRKLEDMTDDDDVIGLKNQLAPCIWDINPISQKVSDKSQIHIVSQVATEEDNQTFHKILESGNYDNDVKDNYSVNYGFFKTQCDKFAGTNPMQWKQLCVAILQRCIIMPIECQNQEMALTIFNTLNDRGLPLADSDIFKAKIYSNFKSKKEREKFTNDWKEFTHICKQANVSLDDIFRYYTHILRARDKDKSKEIGLRSFYAKDEYKRLKENDLMSEILSLSNFWLYVNKNIEPNRDDDSEEKYTITIESRKYLQCLLCYPNEFWKYIVSVFFIKNKNSKEFDNEFVVLLKKLTAFLFAKFIEAPTVNAIKDDIYLSCISVYDENKLSFRFLLNEENIKSKIEEYSSSRLSRALLVLDSYLNQEQVDLVPEIFDIEHIFPKKWQNTNYNGWSWEDAQKYLDKFGNKVIFEKKLNIQAGNGYFGKKKAMYRQSKIANVLYLSNYHKDDWEKEDIEERESIFRIRIINYFKEQIQD